MSFWDRALELKEETIALRRYFHTNAEVGLDLPRTKAYVMKKLQSYGLEPKECGFGVTALLGKKGGKCILLRADMDALPMPEESGEPFACTSGKACHACGHDFHAAMLLTAAKMLKEREDELEGCVKLMFQPAEETFQGAYNMVENGVLENPKPDVALGCHVGPGQFPVGLFMYNNKEAMMFSMDKFCITVNGTGAHGAYPHLSVDPINIGVHIHLALQELIARECDPFQSCLLTVGQFEAGTAPNIIPEVAYLRGSMRTDNPQTREKLLKRMREVVNGTAITFGGTGELEFPEAVPPLICNPDLTDEMVGYIQQLDIEGLKGWNGMRSSASEDFAVIAERVPTAFMYLSAGFLDERGQYSAHNPKVRFNEDVCPIGSACMAHCAVQWLKNNG